MHGVRQVLLAELVAQQTHEGEYLPPGGAVKHYLAGCKTARITARQSALCLGPHPAVKAQHLSVPSSHRHVCGAGGGGGGGGHWIQVFISSGD